jgi:hypothetical protein
LIGASTQLYQTTNSTLMQLLVPTEYRGRVFGIHQMDRGFIPVGSFLAGAIAQVAGAPFAVALMGGTLALAGLGVLCFVPRMRKLHTSFRLSCSAARSSSAECCPRQTHSARCARFSAER